MGILMKAAQRIAQWTAPRQVRSFTSPWYDGQTLPADSNYRTQVEANKHWVYVCVRLIANAVASADLKVYTSKPDKEAKPMAAKMVRAVGRKQYEWLRANPSQRIKEIGGAGDIVEVPEHPFLELLKNVNPHWNQYDLFYMTEAYQQLMGNAYWYLGEDRPGYPPEEIWLPQPEYMEIVGSKAEYIGGYVWRKDIEEVPFKADEIMHLAVFDPRVKDMRYGRGPLTAAAAEYDIYESMNVFDKALFVNMARPEGTLTTKEPIDDNTFKRLKAEWKALYGGASKAGKVAILDQGLEFKPITFSPREIAFLGGRETLPSVIMSVFGVPVTMIKVEEVRANSYAGERQFQKNTVLPRLRSWEEKINERIIPRYSNDVVGVSFPGKPLSWVRRDTNTFVAFDNPVPADVEQDLREREVNLNLGIRTINEVRQEDLGLPPVKWGDEPFKIQPPSPFGEGGGVKPQPGQTAKPDKKMIDEIVSRVMFALEKEKEY